MTWQVALILNLVLGLHFSPQDEVRKPVPSPQSLRKAQITIKDVYGEVFKLRDRQEVKLAAQEMINDAVATKDPAIQYQLLVSAKTALVNIADASNFEIACEHLSERFAVEKDQLLIEGLRSIADKVYDDQSKLGLLSSVKELFFKLARKHDFGNAKKTLLVIRATGRRTRDNSIRGIEKTLREYLKELEAIVARFEDSKNVLSVDSGDADANHAVGEYYAVIEKDFYKAVSYFQKSNRDKVKIAAMTDSQSTSAAQKIKAAEQWLSLGASGDSELRRSFLRRAVELLTKARETSSGIMRKKSEVLLGKIQLPKMGADEPGIGKESTSAMEFGFRIRTKDSKFIVVYDPGSTKHYAVAADSSSERDGLGFAESIEIDGQKFEKITRKQLAMALADGTEHSLTVKMVPEFSKWSTATWAGKYGDKSSGWHLEDGTISKIQSK